MIYSLLLLLFCSMITIQSSESSSLGKHKNKSTTDNLTFLEQCKDPLIKKVYSEINHLTPFYETFHSLYKGNHSKLKLNALTNILQSGRDFHFVPLFLQDDDVKMALANPSSINRLYNPLIIAFKSRPKIAQLFAQHPDIGPLHFKKDFISLNLIKQASQKKSILENVITRVFYNDENLNKERLKHAYCVQLLLNSNCPIESVDENLITILEHDDIQLYGPDDPNKHNPYCIRLIKQEYALQKCFIEYVNNYPNSVYRFALHNKYMPWKKMILDREEIIPEQRELFLQRTNFLSEQ